MLEFSRLEIRCSAVSGGLSDAVNTSIAKGTPPTRSHSLTALE